MTEPVVRPSRVPAVILVLGVVLGLLSALVRFGPSTDAGHRVVAWAVNGLRVGDVGRLWVDGIEGDPWGEFTIARAEIRDGRGAWIVGRDVRLSWRSADLWRREVHIVEAMARSITVSRPPELLPPEAATPSPVSLRIDKVATLLTLMPALAGRRGDYLVEGGLSLARDNALSGRVSAVSLMHPGDFLRANFNVSDTTVGLEAHASEATGGALAGSLGLDGNKPFLLDARAHGSPKAGWFALASTVGNASPATARGVWSPAGGEASGRLDLTASHWLADWRAGLGPEASFHLTAARGAGDVYRTDFDARSQKVTLTAKGEVDPSHRRTGRAGVAIALSATDLSAFLGAPGFGAGRASGVLTGSDIHWVLAGTATAGGIDQAGYHLASAGGPFRLESVRGGLSLKADAVGAGGGGTSPVALLLGGAPRASADLGFLDDGRVLLRRVQLKGAALEVNGQGERGLLGGLSFKGKAVASNLALASPGARGTIEADWRAGQNNGTAPWTFSFDARGQGLRLNAPEADSLLGAAPRAHAEGRLAADGLTLTKASFDGGGLALTGAGKIGPVGELVGKVEASGNGPLVVGPLALSGAFSGSGTLNGTVDKPRLDATAVLKTLDLPDAGDLRLTDAHVTLSLQSDGDALAGHLGLTAASGNGPARAAAGFRLAGADASLTDIDLVAGGVSAQGRAAFHAGAPTQADLVVSVGPGMFLASGRADGRVSIAAAAEGPRAKVTLKGANLVFPESTGGLESLNFTADGPLSRLPYKLDARGVVSGLRARLAGGGDLTQAGGVQTASFTGAGRFGAADIKSLLPAEIAFRPSGVTGGLHVAIGQGRADITFNQSGDGLSGHAVVANLDLGLLDPEIRGRADGVLDLSRVGDALVGTAQARVAGVSGRDLQGESPLAGSLDATFSGGVIALRTQLADAQGSKVAADLRIPAVLSASPLKIAVDSHAPLSGHFSADGAVGPLWDLLEGGGQSLTGRLVAQGAIGGTVADPKFTGTAGISGGAFADSSVGLRLEGLAIQADLRGDVIDVTRFAATDGLRGSVSGSGRLSLIRGAASAFQLTLKGFRLVDTTLGQATASGLVNVDRATDGKVRLGGNLTIDRAQISPMAPTPNGVVAMEVTEIHRPFDLAVAAAAPAEREPPVALDIGLKAPSGIFIKGRGLNLEMSLDAHVSGTIASPSLTGVARVVRGDYDFAGKRFQIDDRGVVVLGSTAETIRLDLTATRDDPTLTAIIRIQGTAAAPTLVLSSTPALPQDQVLSQVLFGASAAQLSGFQAAQLASAMAGLAGGGGFDVIGGLRNFAHLDRLAIDSAATTGFTVSGGKYVTDKLYVEISDSAKTGQGAQVEWRLLKHLSLVSRVTSQGDHAVSVRWRRDY